MAPVREVAFELECFEWAEETLEVAGRWQGVGARRLSRPVLTVETDGGRRKRIVALPGGQLGGAGENWRASFSWPGDPAEITGAALEVGGNLVVDLPLPDRRRRRRRRPSGDPGGDDTQRAEVTALRGQVERLRAELAGREREIIALRAQLDDETEGEPDVPRAAADERTVEIQRLAGELERLREAHASIADERTVEVQQLARERDEARAERTADDERRRAEQAHLEEELDALREAFSDAAAEAEAARDHHRAQVEALEDELRGERAQIARLTAALAAADAPADRDTARGRGVAAASGAAGAAGGDAATGSDAAASGAAAAGGSDAAASGAAGAGGDAELGHRSASEPGADPDEGPDAGLPTQPMPPPVDALDAGDAPPQAGPPTQPMPAPFADDEAESASAADGGGNDPTAVEAAVLDAPGPMLAGGRPVTPPGSEDQPQVSRVPGWLRGGGEPGDSPLQALRERFEGLFASNGHAEEVEIDDGAPPVPRPRRSAAAARARAGATVAARRSPTEVWAMRVLAALVVAVLLITFVLVITAIA